MLLVIFSAAVVFVDVDEKYCQFQENQIWTVRLGNITTREDPIFLKMHCNAFLKLIILLFNNKNKSIAYAIANIYVPNEGGG